MPKWLACQLGALALNDETVLDLSHRIMHQTIRDMGEKSVNPHHMELVENLVEKRGYLSRKNGKEFYSYPDKPEKKQLWHGLKDIYPQLKPEQVNVEEIKNRFHAVIALETVHYVEEGIVEDIQEADIGSIPGVGFAPFTGGAQSLVLTAWGLVLSSVCTKNCKADMKNSSGWENCC